MITEIKPTDTKSESFEISVKRFYVPFVVVAKCPKCGHEIERDLSNNYLSYPQLDLPESIDFNHDVGEWGKEGYENHEWIEHIVIKIVVVKAE